MLITAFEPITRSHGWVLFRVMPPPAVTYWIIWAETDGTVVVSHPVLILPRLISAPPNDFVEGGGVSNSVGSKRRPSFVMPRQRRLPNLSKLSKPERSDVSLSHGELLRVLAMTC